jgi:hypothetical protein
MADRFSLQTSAPDANAILRRVDSWFPVGVMWLGPEARPQQGGLVRRWATDQSRYKAAGRQGWLPRCSSEFDFGEGLIDTTFGIRCGWRMPADRPDSQRDGSPAKIKYLAFRTRSDHLLTPSGWARRGWLPILCVTLRWLPGSLSPVIPECLCILQRVFRGIHG